MVRGRQSHPKIGVSHHAAICIQKAFRGYAHRVVYKRAVVNAERMKYRLLMRISEQDARVAQLTEQNKSFRMMVESMAPVLAPGMQVSLESARFCEDGQHRHLILGKDGNAAINIDPKRVNATGTVTENTFSPSSTRETTWSPCIMQRTTAFFVFLMTRWILARWTSTNCP